MSSPKYLWFFSSIKCKENILPMFVLFYRDREKLSVLSSRASLTTPSEPWTVEEHVWCVNQVMEINWKENFLWTSKLLLYLILNYPKFQRRYGLILVGAPLERENHSYSVMEREEGTYCPFPLVFNNNPLLVFDLINL